MIETKKLKKTEYQDLILQHVNQYYLDFVLIIKTSTIKLATFGRRLKTGFEDLLHDCHIDQVIIENQIGPLALRMKMLQGMIMQHFTEIGCTCIIYTDFSISEDRILYTDIIRWL